MPEISVIIVTLNGREYLEACLTAVAAQEGVDAEAIVVDNGSTDGTAEFIRTRFPKVRLIRQDVNCGFAGGCNVGAREAKGRYLAFLNNDTVADRGWLRALRRGLDEPHGVSLCTSLIVYMHDPNAIDSAGDGVTRAGGAFKRLHGQRASLASTSREVFSACGGAFLISRAVFEELDGFDEDFFASHEDVDLSYRARLRGYRCQYVADAIVQHRGSSTLGRVSPFAVYHSQRNLEWTYFKNTPASLLIRTLPSHLVYNAAAALHFARIGRFGPFLRGKVAACAALGQIVRKRSAVQGTRRVPPAAIWRMLEPHWLAIKLREERFDTSIASPSSVV